MTNILLFILIPLLTLLPIVDHPNVESWTSEAITIAWHSTTYEQACDYNGYASIVIYDIYAEEFFHETISHTTCWLEADLTNWTGLWVLPWSPNNPPYNPHTVYIIYYGEVYADNHFTEIFRHASVSVYPPFRYFLSYISR